MSAATVRAAAQHLCAHVRLLKSVHKAGLTPSFGQVEDLFDLADGLEQVIDSLGVDQAVRSCTRPECAAAATSVVAGRPYCDPCGAAVRKLLKQVEGFGLETVRGNWPVPSGAGLARD